MSDSQSLIKKLYAALRKPSVSYSILTLVIIGFVAGILFSGGYGTAMDATNQLEFCIGCHEMENNVYQEYKKTIHYTNRSGVRATCPDCHVPRDFAHKLMRKIQASKEVWGRITGTIDTKEKFEAKRLTLAQHEWDRMKANDSRECRHCHSFEGMDQDKQKQRSRKNHEMAQKDGKTCIDCHKGIAHQKPKGMPEDDE
ncbi:MAG: NapC/NirT family cytochrome c [Gallionellaceae bacterium]|nr:NapC/NirT family cytochrome c [Gallionellaceae bacterium]